MRRKSNKPFTVSISQNNGVKPLLDYTNLFSRDDYENNGKIIYKYFKDKFDKGKDKP